MALGRYDQRKNFEEAEANAIGTEYVRADLLPAPDAAKVRELLKTYLDQRVLFYTTRDEAQLHQIDTRTTKLQNDLWSVVQARAAVQPTQTVALAVSGMNDVLNSQGYTQAAWWYRISFARIDDLPQEASKDKETLHLQGPKSNVTFPLSAGGRNIGALGFGSLRVEREWPVALVDRLGIAAQIFANALSRAHADRELNKAYQAIAELKQQVEKENVYLREEVRLERHQGEVVGDSEGIRRVLQEVEQVASTDSTVLVLGETGTGKELIARTIHELSRRKGRVMVKVNCAALPATLIESEMFGREKGAFTGALTREMGRLELANGSTILLDEVGELPIELQSKLLRVGPPGKRI